MKTPETITVTLTPLPDDRPVEVRVRQLLKYARRAQALRAVDISPGTAAPADQDHKLMENSTR
jgi:hypothetical protein